MNVERLTEIVTAIKADLEQTNLLGSIANIMASLDAIMSQPPNPSHEDTLNQHIDQFSKAIDTSSVSDFPTTWRPYLEEIGIQDLLGEPLRNRVMQARHRNEITAKIFKDELQAVHTELNTYLQSFNHIVVGMGIFNFSSTAVEAGSAELSFLLPRAGFDNALKAFSSEIKFFDDTTRFFSELATGGRDEPKLNQLSTTEPVVTIAAAMGTALLFLKVVEKVLDVMTKTHKLREAKLALELAEARIDTVRSLQSDIDAVIKTGLDEVKEWLFVQYKVPKARLHELKTEANRLLEKLAYRIDNGYKIDGDISPLPDEEMPEGEEQSPELVKARKLASELVEVAKKIRHHESSDGPVLQLPKPDEDEGKAQSEEG